MVHTNVELYGYNDSSQEDDYHYQSFLYGVQKNAIQKLVDHYNKVESLLTGYNELINNFEKKLTTIFERKDCFLPIAYIQGHRGKNVYFNNDSLYLTLKRAGVMSIVKTKRINGGPIYHPHIPSSSQRVGGLVSAFNNYGANLPKYL